MSHFGGNMTAGNGQKWLKMAQNGLVFEFGSRKMLEEVMPHIQDFLGRNSRLKTTPNQKGLSKYHV